MFHDKEITIKNTCARVNLSQKCPNVLFHFSTDHALKLLYCKNPKVFEHTKRGGFVNRGPDIINERNSASLKLENSGLTSMIDLLGKINELFLFHILDTIGIDILNKHVLAKNKLPSKLRILNDESL